MSTEAREEQGVVRRWPDDSQRERGLGTEGKDMLEVALRVTNHLLKLHL